MNQHSTETWKTLFQYWLIEFHMTPFYILLLTSATITHVWNGKVYDILHFFKFEVLTIFRSFCYFFVLFIPIIIFILVLFRLYTNKNFVNFDKICRENQFSKYHFLKFLFLSFMLADSIYTQFIQLIMRIALLQNVYTQYLSN